MEFEIRIRLTASSRIHDDDLVEGGQLLILQATIYRTHLPYIANN